MNLRVGGMKIGKNSRNAHKDLCDTVRHVDTLTTTV
jgi:hypothetical protein